MRLNEFLCVRFLRAVFGALILAVSVSAMPKPAGAVSVLFPGGVFVSGLVSVSLPQGPVSVQVMDTIAGTARLSVAITQAPWHSFAFSLYRLALNGASSTSGDGLAGISAPLEPLFSGRITAPLAASASGTGGASPLSNGLGGLFGFSLLGATEDPFELADGAPDVQGISFASGTSDEQETPEFLLLWQVLQEAAGGEDGGEDDGGSVSGPPIALVPLPAAITLLLGSIIALGAVARWRRVEAGLA